MKVNYQHVASEDAKVVSKSFKYQLTLVKFMNFLHNLESYIFYITYQKNECN